MTDSQNGGRYDFWTLHSVFVALVIISGAMGAGVYAQSPDTELSGEIHIGSIMPLTGKLAKHGEENWAGTLLATNDFNKYLADKGAGWWLKTTVEDSQTLPTAALDKLQSLHAKGVKIIMGPEASANLQNMKGYADANQILLFSCCSTSPFLAIPGDTVLRMAPDDSNQGKASSRFLVDAGIEAVVPVWREDAWGVGIQEASRNSLESRGSIMDEGLGYNPEASDFSTEAAILAERVQGYVDEYGPDRVAVMHLGFGEVLLFMQSASAYDVLHDVRWFGSAANTKDPTLIEDPIGLRFVSDTRYTTFQAAAGKNELNRYVEDSVAAELGRTPSTYASSSYDAVWVVGLAMERAQSADVAALMEVIPEIAAEYTGAIGSTRLNDNGDLAQTNYDIWQIRDGSWILAGTYYSTTDSVELSADSDVTAVSVPVAGAMDDEAGSAGEPSGGGCLIATAAYGSELAPQVQFLREIRDGALLSTASGSSFMAGFNQFYYSFSPAVADLERENAVFRDAVRVAITPALYTLNIMALADQNSDASVIAFGLLAIAAMASTYVAGPVLAVRTVGRKIRNRHGQAFAVLQGESET